MATPNERKSLLSTLAWIIRHFVGLVVERPMTFWHSMHVGRRLEDYVTPSDLAFAVLLVEHHIMEWRTENMCLRETGMGQLDVVLKGRGLLYKDGVAGKEAKDRFRKLVLCFHANYYNRQQGQRNSNMTSLHECVQQLATADSSVIEALVDNHEPFIGGTQMKDIQEDILHRVFYYMHS